MSSHKPSRTQTSSLIVLASLIGLIVYSVCDDASDGFAEDYSAFTIELNCTLPSISDHMDIVSVGEGQTSQEELVTLATRLFHMDNATITHEGKEIILESGEKTLHCYPTDYIKYRDKTIDRDKIVPANDTALHTRADSFLDSLWEVWPLPEGDEIRFERLEYPDLAGSGSNHVSTQPQYVVYYHYIDGIPVLALNAEFNLGFAEGRVVYADISRLHTVSFERVELTKTPIQAILEAFPGAEFRGGGRVSSRVWFPVRGRIFVENFRVMHYNWHGPDSKPVGEAYVLFPYYKFDALVIGPDERGITQSIRLNREIKAIK